MIPKEQAEQYLASVKPQKLTKEDFDRFPEPYRTLGKYIANLLGYSEDRNFERQISKINLPEKLWETKEGKALALLVFGEVQAPYAQRVWDAVLEFPYQDSYQRRSFRSSDPSDYAKRRILEMKYLSFNYQYGIGTLPFAEQFRYQVYAERSVELLYGLVLNDNPEAYLSLIEDIFSGEDEIGGVCGTLIKAALMAKEERYRTLVEKLLLAAQLQEGLRQSIFESLDSTTIDNLKHFIRVILDHNLSRFSSVVRAVDTWFGFGWEAPQQSVVKRTLELALACLSDTEEAKKAIESKDNLERYVGLWAIGVYNVQEALALAVKALNNTQTSYEACIVILYFMKQTQKKVPDILPFAEAYFGIEPAWDCWILHNLPKGGFSDTLFEKIRTAAKKLPKDGKTFEGVGFRWLNFTVRPVDMYRELIEVANEKQQEILASELGEIPVDVRHTLLQDVYPVLGRSRYYYYDEDEKEQTPENYPADSWQRKLVRTAVNDKGAYVAGKAMDILKGVSLVQEDILAIEQVLSRKNKELRKESVALLSQQPETVLKDSTSRLIVSKSADQRLAALEILTVLQDEKKLTEYVAEQVEAYKGRKLSKNEQVLMDKLTFTETTGKEQRDSLLNGFGLIDVNNLTPFIEPQPQFDKEHKASKGHFFLKNLVNVEKITNALNDLIAIFEKNADYEYQVEGWNGETYTEILKNGFRRLHKEKEDETPEEILNDYPLAQKWQEWWDKHQLNEFECYFISLECDMIYYWENTDERLLPFFSEYRIDLSKVNFGENRTNYRGYPSKISHFIDRFINAYADRTLLANFKLSLWEDALSRFPASLKGETFRKGRYSSLEDWVDVVYDCVGHPCGFGSYSDFDYLTDEQLLHVRGITGYLRMSGFNTDPKNLLLLIEKHNKKEERMDNNGNDFAASSLILYQKGLITRDDLLLVALGNDDTFEILSGKSIHNWKKITNKLSLEQDFLSELYKKLLAVELQRGDLMTDASVYVTKIQEIEGIQYFFEALERMGKEPFAKGYGSGVSKRFVFSHILEVSTPSDTDTFAGFKKHLNEVKIDKKRLVEAACYATQWADWIGDYLKLKNFNEAVWWFIAHTTDYMNAEKETVISRYSNVPRDDFQRGAIDVDWYHRVHKNVGKEGWKLIQESAKYLSEGMGYRRVKLYSSVLTGEIKLKEAVEKITQKRDKDYVMALGLIPISKKKTEEDLVSRYNLLQTFLKESKQFGQQRQESEKNAVEVGLDNLARNAGFEDSIRFSWAMEAKATQQIMEKATLTLDDTELQLVIDEQGKADIVVRKGEKVLKSIPDKYKKNKEVEALKEGKTYLNKQYSRTRQSLENAMLSQTLFSVKELSQIMAHPIVRVMLSKLVLFNPETQVSGFWQDGQLLSTEGKLQALSADEQLLIAHPSHLYYAVQWDLYQKYLFDQGLQQPFKQVFRELYIPTADELEHSNRSERYQGHQVQPQKTVALLRSRGWSVNYGEGLQKVYHKEGYRAEVYAVADWFTPSDVEAPTLEYVVFYNLKDGKEVPMKDISPVIFSEVMRDVDLVVSVAHIGGVDPEASHSTMQMRAALARESARLFKLSNVEVKERYILVKGKLGDYNIHLGSGMVQRAGLQLNIIAVQSQHRGRVFLPFVDDDPKSAEIISKMRLLAEDDKIKDPTILAQLMK